MMSISNATISGCTSTIFSEAPRTRENVFGKVVTWREHPIVCADWLSDLAGGAEPISERIARLAERVDPQRASISFYFIELEQARAFVEAVGVPQKLVMPATWGQSAEFTVAEFGALRPSDELILVPGLKHVSLESHLGDVHIAPSTEGGRVTANFTPNAEGRALALETLKLFPMRGGSEPGAEIRGVIEALPLRS